MVIIQFGKYLFHDSFTEKNGPRTYPELLAILPDRRHLTVIQIDDLPVLAHKRLLLFPEIVRVYACGTVFLRFSHFAYCFPLMRC